MPQLDAARGGEDRLASVLRLCHQLTNAASLDAMFASVVDALVQGAGVTRAAVLTFDDSGVMRFRAAHGLSPEYQSRVDGHSPWSADTVNPPALLINDAASDPAVASLREILAAERIGALAFLPLSGGGRLLGKFMLYSEQQTEWQEVDLEFARAAADLLASFLMRERTHEHLQQARKMESLGLLAGGIAHDFNNMLTSMLGYVDLLRVESVRGTPARDYVEELRVVVEQASDLTRQLLGFARPQLPSTAVVDLRQFIEDARPALQHACGPRHVLRIDIVGAPAPVRAGQSQLLQLLTNLVTNARDAMPAGGQAVLTLRPGQPGMVEIEVSDTGIGMDEGTRRRIFEPLFTTKMMGRGTGLGLATCYAVVTSLGGDIRVRSAVGRGSDFTVTLPAAIAPAVPQPAQSAVEPGHRVLLVDDQEYVLRPLIRSLEMAGYAVHSAGNGRQALALLDELDVDVVVSDVIMPEMDGVELAAEVRRRQPTLPVILMTGYVEAARELPPGVPVLLKPFKARELCLRIDQLVSPSRSVTQVDVKARTA